MESFEQHKITIEREVAEDYDEIMDLLYRTWLATYPNEEYGITVDDIESRFANRHDDFRRQRNAESLDRQPKNEISLVAKDGKKNIGICRGSMDNVNKLRVIYVLPEAQGRGVGSAMWNKLLNEFFDPSKDIKVEVAEYNHNAIEFYKKLGFVSTGVRFSPINLRLKSGAIIPEIEMVIRRERG